jgi:hypothetical protein
MVFNKDYRENNVVRVGSNTKIESYISSIILRMNPRIYDMPEHKCIKIQVRDSLLEFTETIIKRLKWCGLRVVSKKKKDLEAGEYILKQGWEITLEKIPILQTMDFEEEL